MTQNMNVEILKRGNHAELRLVVFEEKTDNGTPLIALEVTGCGSCLENAVINAMIEHEGFMAMMERAIYNASKNKAQNVTPMKVKRVNPNLN